jgi:streptogramin lyase
LAISLTITGYAQSPGTVVEFSIPYPTNETADLQGSHTMPMGAGHAGSTHEFAYNNNGGNAIWITGQNYDTLVKVALDGEMKLYSLPQGSGPHGIDFDAGLSFDKNNNLWVQQYVDQNNPEPTGPDHIIKIDKTVLTAKPSDAGKLSVISYPVPTRKTVMHRIIQGPDGNMWFTEMKSDKIGKLITRRSL